MGKMSKQAYEAYVMSLCPKSKTLRNCIWAFCVGGAICTLGQALRNFFSGPVGLDQKMAGCAVCVSLVFLSALLTSFSIYDDIARRAGAGTLVPITGFANAVVSPAMEFKSEGFILGVGAKMFTIAGPVIVYGVAASVVYGMIYWITTLF